MTQKNEYVTWDPEDEFSPLGDIVKDSKPSLAQLCEPLPETEGYIELNIIRLDGIHTRFFNKEKIPMMPKCKHIDFLDINEYMEDLSYEPEYYDQTTMIVWVNIMNHQKAYLHLKVDETREPLMYYSENPNGLWTEEGKYRNECLEL